MTCLVTMYRLHLNSSDYRDSCNVKRFGAILITCLQKWVAKMCDSWQIGHFVVRAIMLNPIPRWAVTFIYFVCIYLFQALVVLVLTMFADWVCIIAIGLYRKWRGACWVCLLECFLENRSSFCKLFATQKDYGVNAKEPSVCMPATVDLILSPFCLYSNFLQEPPLVLYTFSNIGHFPNRGL